jgi:hypothetical protein
MFYHLGRANVVADALSIKSRSAENELMSDIDQLTQQFTIIQIDKVLVGKSPIMAVMLVQPLLKSKIKQAQHNDLELQKLINEAKDDKTSRFCVTSNGVLKTKDVRIVVPNDDKLKNEILDEAHQTKYTIHPGNTKMYQTLKKKFWWSGMKGSVAEYVARCPSCQLMKTEHQRLAGQLQPLEVPMWKWDQVAIDFVIA